jgi:hypothetical protein
MQSSYQEREDSSVHKDQQVSTPLNFSGMILIMASVGSGDTSYRGLASGISGADFPVGSATS